MGPKTFIPCYVCFKEFSSRSISFHEPRCLERWRVTNKCLSSDKRIPTPIKPTDTKDSTKNEDNTDRLKSNSQKSLMTGGPKQEFSPKKGKENKNFSNNFITVKKLAKNEAKVEAADEMVKDDNSDDVFSTTKRSVRPGTKILRRPTPNLNHPVIQFDSDDSGESSCSDKSKEANPKRLKMADSNSHKKNFIMYNKNNVDKNTKNSKSAPQLSSSKIPDPCNTCSRSQAPERLHSHAKKDSRCLMIRKSPSMENKMAASPQKKATDASEKKNKEHKIDDKEQQNDQKDKVFVTTKQEKPSKTPEIVCLLMEPTTPDDLDVEDVLKACYICKKEFKVSALLLHESKCLEIWKKTNNALNPNQRQLPPRRPIEVGLLHGDVAWSAIQSQLIPCSNCGRTFFPERLPIHAKVCKGSVSPKLRRTASLREQSAGSSDGEEAGRTAVYVPCYVCGRSYGSWVITMHEQQCLRKWRRENENLPEEEQKHEPKKMSSSDDVASLIELGENAWESHLQQLVPCPLCSRTFFPDRLGVHTRSCKGSTNNNGRRPRSNNGT